MAQPSCASDILFCGVDFDQQLVWDTSKVTTMGATFRNTNAFNSQLAWDTSQVTHMYGTFQGAEAFNQPLAWDTTKVTNFADFRQCGALTQKNPACSN